MMLLESILIAGGIMIVLLIAGIFCFFAGQIVVMFAEALGFDADDEKLARFGSIAFAAAMVVLSAGVYFYRLSLIER